MFLSCLCVKRAPPKLYYGPLEFASSRHAIMQSMTMPKKSRPHSSSTAVVRTRIAPSPTGMPHIGTLYQALFDYAFAKRHKGSFLIRIEDTDQERSVQGAEEALYDAFDWLGIPEDESPRKGGSVGPYRQSERLDLYKQHALELVKKGHAYYCFCSKERLEEVRKQQSASKQVPMYDRHCLALVSEEIQTRLDAGEKPVIRMKIPQGEKIVCRDEVRGDIVFDSNLIDDQVLLKSDGFPTYHLAVVVDDHFMKISHIVRGEEWISSLPKHKLLYDWFGWDMPPMYHTPLLRNPDKSKMSKRHGHTSVVWYQEHGILPEALRNFLALLGWSHPKDAEIFSLDEFISSFDLKDLKAVGPIFDPAKLEWMNGEYIRMLPVEELAKRLQEYNEKFLKSVYSIELIHKTVPLVQTRLKTFQEYDGYCHFFIEAPRSFEKDLTAERDVIKSIAGVLEKFHEQEWQAEALGTRLQTYAEKQNIPFKSFFMTLRVALTGKKITPPLNESMEILGKEETLKRLK